MYKDTDLKQEIMLLLDNRTFLYKLFQSLFGNEPSAELIDILNDPATAEALEMFDESSSYKEALSSIMNTVSDYDLSQLKSEYTKLFIGPGKLPAPPWESVYLSGESVLLDENTLKVRKSYMAHGFIPAEYPHVADDHLSLELDFMNILSRQALDQYSEQGSTLVKELLITSKSFLEGHLLVWVPEFADKLKNQGTFYPELARLLTAFLKIDREIVIEITENI